MGRVHIGEDQGEVDGYVYDDKNAMTGRIEALGRPNQNVPYGPALGSVYETTQSRWEGSTRPR